VLEDGDGVGVALEYDVAVDGIRATAAGHGHNVTSPLTLLDWETTEQLAHRVLAARFRSSSVPVFYRLFKKLTQAEPRGGDRRSKGSSSPSK
jgi:hypothetical protein